MSETDMKKVYTTLDYYLGRHETVLSGGKQLRERLQKIAEERRPTVSDVLKTHNMFTVRTFKPHVAVASDYYKKPREGADICKVIRGQRATIKFNLQGNSGTWIHDQVVRIRLPGVTAPAGSYYRYCALPGVRLFDRVRLTTKTNQLIDEYTSDDVLMEEWELDSDYIEAYKRNLGQEQKLSGTHYNPDFGITQHFTYSSGAQTPKTEQTGLDLWIPLFFWYNRRIEHALAICRMDVSQLNITIELAPLEKILGRLDTNYQRLDLTIQHLAISSCELYTRNIYVNPEIADIFRNATHNSMIRVHKQHQTGLTKSSDNLLLHNLKFPIEYISFGFRPIENESSLDDWLRFTKASSMCYPMPAIILHEPKNKLVSRTSNISTYTQVVNGIGISAQSVTLYPFLPPVFYNRHMVVANPHLTLPEDEGKFIASFALYPGSGDISGHLNNIGAREFYMSYQSSVITDSYRAMLVVTAKCYNFLRFQDKQVSLVYA